jgi:hypothetical protein
MQKVLSLEAAVSAQPNAIKETSPSALQSHGAEFCQVLNEGILAEVIQSVF